MSSDNNIVIDPNPTFSMVLGAVRILIGAAGGSLVSSGVLTQDRLDTIVGALMTLGVAGWVAWLNRKNTRKLTVLADAAPDDVGRVK